MGCPVSRLTLLFFGAAKDSGSSRNGHRRDNPSLFRLARQRPSEKSAAPPAGSIYFINFY
jgi:hypothetical protein